MLNTGNVNQRDLILFSEPYDEKNYHGGIRRFESLSWLDLEELFRLNVVDGEDRQNCSPSVQEVREFMKEHPIFKAHGYAVSPKRDDYRVSIEGVQCGSGFDLDDVVAFFTVFHDPDELSVDRDGIYCWFD